MERDSMLVNTYTYTHAITMYTNRKRIVYFRQTRQKKRKTKERNPLDSWSEAFTLKATPKAPQHILVFYTHAPYHGAMRIPPYNSQFVSLLLLRLPLSQLMGLLRLLLEPNSTDVIVELGSSETPLFAVELRLKELMRGALIEHWTVNEYNHTHTHTCILGFMFTVFRYYLK